MDEPIATSSGYHDGWSDALKAIWDSTFKKFMNESNMEYRSHLYMFLHSICKLHYGFCEETFHKHLNNEIKRERGLKNEI